MVRIDRAEMADARAQEEEWRLQDEADEALTYEALLHDRHSYEWSQYRRAVRDWRYDMIVEGKADSLADLGNRKHKHYRYFKRTRPRPPYTTARVPTHWHWGAGCRKVRLGGRLALADGSTTVGYQVISCRPNPRPAAPALETHRRTRTPSCPPHGFAQEDGVWRCLGCGERYVGPTPDGGYQEEI